MKNLFIAFVIAVLVIVGVKLINANDAQIQAERAQRITRIIRVSQEWAYYWGQKDALNHDVCIAEQPNGRFKWSRSCWDGETNPPTFNPYVSEDLGYALTNALNEQ